MTTYRIHPHRGWYADVRARSPREARYLAQSAWRIFADTGRMVGRDAAGLIIELKQTVGKDKP